MSVNFLPLKFYGNISPSTALILITGVLTVQYYTCRSINSSWCNAYLQHVHKNLRRVQLSHAQPVPNPSLRINLDTDMDTSNTTKEEGEPPPHTHTYTPNSHGGSLVQNIRKKARWAYNVHISTLYFVRMVSKMYHLQY